MKKNLLLICTIIFILLLSSCSVKGVTLEECVNDTIIFEAEPQYTLSAEIPTQMLLSVSLAQGNQKVYTQADGDYEIITDVFSASDLDSALLRLTGQTYDQLRPVALGQSSVDEYRYAWTATGEDGSLTCCGTLLYDGLHYYSLSIHCKSALQNTYREKFTHILSTVGLQSNEGF
ncbi:MAG: hypothetical protein LBM28_05565 [Oscillospiraceae bacterium]|jgi:hypothetical protein|nr:hypothetical protein [Oscillospiraceae bacterium]